MQVTTTLILALCAAMCLLSAKADVNGIVQQCYGNSWIIADEDSIEVEKQWDGSWAANNTPGTGHGFKRNAGGILRPKPPKGYKHVSQFPYMPNLSGLWGGEGSNSNSAPLAPPPAQWIIVRKYGTDHGGIKITTPSTITALMNQAATALGVTNAAQIRDLETLAIIGDVSVINSGEILLLTTTQQEASFLQYAAKTKWIIVRKFGAKIGGSKIRCPNTIKDLLDQGAKRLGIQNPQKVRDAEHLAEIVEIEAIHDNDVVFVTTPADEEYPY